MEIGEENRRQYGEPIMFLTVRTVVIKSEGSVPFSFFVNEYVNKFHIANEANRGSVIYT